MMPANANKSCKASKNLDRSNFYYLKYSKGNARIEYHNHMPLKNN